MIHPQEMSPTGKATERERRLMADGAVRGREGKVNSDGYRYLLGIMKIFWSETLVLGAQLRGYTEDYYALKQ